MTEEQLLKMVNYLEGCKLYKWVVAVFDLNIVNYFF